MIKIVGEEKEIKKYTKAVNELLTLYKNLNDGENSRLFTDKQFKNILQKALENPSYGEDTLKGRVLRENLLSDKSLSDIARESMYSISRIYDIKHKILKEFASVTFGVIIL
ncbi:MAG: hypothetical protein E7411_03160 [Ruminococcaceae bacterium]|nr:hypothetical protein [Oscillospiraceae bacterium]